MHHTGRGKWAVFHGEERLTEEPLSKEEAAAALQVFEDQAKTG